MNHNADRTGAADDAFSIPVTGRSPKIKDLLMKALWFATAIFAVVAVFFILLFLLKDGLPIFDYVSIHDFIFGQSWRPTADPPQFGTFPLITGTVLVTIGATIISSTLGIGSAIFISEIAPARVRAVVKPAVELLAGIPSVVYGFFGLMVLTDWIRVEFGVPSGSSWLAGSILLGIMSLPTVISVSEDAISSVPREFKEGSLAVGATHWQTIRRVLIPSALSGITAALILGLGRAIGETMAVMMVTGNTAIVPDPIYNVLSPVRTLTGTLGIEMGEVPFYSEHYYALFGVTLILLVITLSVNVAAMLIMERLREQNRAVRSRRRLLQLSPPTAERLATGARYAVLALIILAIAFIGSIVAAGAALAILAVLKWASARIAPALAQKIAFSLVGVCIFAVLLFLAIILFDIISKGLPAISWDFLTQPPRDLGREGGIFPAIMGTLYLVLGAILMMLPIGIGAAIYLHEYTREGAVTKVIRSGVDLLNGTPSIVFGLFGFAFLVLYLELGVSLLVGQITLGLMILPTIIRTTEEALRSVPDSLREGSLALGATKWQTIRRVVLPPALPGVLTGAILSIGRAAGETAPILFTAAVFIRYSAPTSLFEPVMALPYHLYILATNVPGAQQNQYGTALVLLGLVVIIYSAAIWLRHHYQKKTTW
jgi:phosphate transport system permease protein